MQVIAHVSEPDLATLQLVRKAQTRMSLLFISGTTLKKFGKVHVEVSTKKNVCAEQCEEVARALEDIATAVDASRESSDDEQQQACAELTQSESTLFHSVQGAKAIVAAVFAALIVKALTRPSDECVEQPLIIITFLQCYSTDIAEIIQTELTKDWRNPKVAKLRGKLLMISVKDQWPATESVRIIDVIMREADPSLGTSQARMRESIMQCVQGDLSVCRRQMLISTKEAGKNWHDQLQFHEF